MPSIKGHEKTPDQVSKMRIQSLIQTFENTKHFKYTVQPLIGVDLVQWYLVPISEDYEDSVTLLITYDVPRILNSFSYFVLTASSKVLSLLYERRNQISESSVFSRPQL